MGLLPIIMPGNGGPFRLTALTLDGSTSLPSSSADPGRSKSMLFNAAGTQINFADEDTDIVYRATLSTAWDVTTRGSWSSTVVSTQDDVGIGMAWNADGTKFFQGTGQGEDPTGTDYREFPISSAYDLTSHGSETASIAGGEGDFVTYVYYLMASDGSKVIRMYDGKWYESTLSTPYSLATAGAWSAAVLDLTGTYGTSITSADWGRPGRSVILCDEGSGTLREYVLSTDNDFSTATLRDTFNVGVECMSARFSDDGSKLYVATNSTIRQYSVG